MGVPDAFSVIKYPIGFKDARQMKFLVDMRAHKPMIKKALNEQYGLNVKKVRTFIAYHAKEKVKKKYAYVDITDPYEVARILGFIEE